MSQEKRALIAAIDLTAAKKKFLAKKSWWWKLRHSVEDVERDYKDYLFLIVTNQCKISCTQDINDLWHEHILDTRKYRDDCARINDGKFIHHPHLPRGAPDHAKHSSEMKRLWQEAYGKLEDASYQRGFKDGFDGLNMFSTSDRYMEGHADGCRSKSEKTPRDL